MKKQVDWDQRIAQAALIISLALFLVVILVIIAEAISKSPDPRGQFYLPYGHEDITLLVDYEVGAVCWLRPDTMACLPINELNKSRLLGMIHGIPVVDQNPVVPAPYRQSEFPEPPPGKTYGLPWYYGGQDNEE